MITKNELLQVRIRSNDKAIVKKAANLEGVSIGEFVRQAALEKAKKQLVIV